MNVGGKNKLPMKALAQMFVDARCTDVETYIASGNVIFETTASGAKTIAKRIGAAISESHGFGCTITLRNAEEMARIIAANPYVAKGIDPKELYVMFLADEPKASAVASLDPARSPGDTYVARGREIYMRLKSAADTKLTNVYFDAKLATTSTSRNWNTVCKLAEKLGVA